jgi:peptidoglycan L-alanyl-D-glutamate endopeptidase CwlK
VTGEPKANRDPNTLTPKLARGWERFQLIMGLLDHPVFLTECVRSFERQTWLYEQGREREGLIVTNARAGESDHNPNEMGLSDALDFAFRGKDPWSEGHPWALAGTLAGKLGLLWGGSWSQPDRPHIYV